MSNPSHNVPSMIRLFLIALVASLFCLSLVYLTSPRAYANVPVLGVPSFTEQPFALGERADINRVVVVENLNSNPLPEIIIGDEGGQNLIYLNYDPAVEENRSYGFGTGSDATRDIAVHDIDRDGRKDIIVGNYNQQSVVYLNKRDDAFYSGLVICTVTPDVLCLGDPLLTTSIEVANLNGGDYSEIIVGNEDDKNKIFSYNGRGFDSIDFGANDNNTHSLAAATINGDPYPDIIAGNFGQSFVYLNHGDGTFYEEDNEPVCGSLPTV